MAETNLEHAFERPSLSFVVNRLLIAQLISGRFANSMKLAGLTSLLAVPIALTLGITSAMLRGSVYDRCVTVITIGVITIGVISVPEFMIATSAVLLFAVTIACFSGVVLGMIAAVAGGWIEGDL